MIVSVMPGASEEAWPKSALPCPRCGNNETILRGSADGCIERFQCPCGWMSWASSGYAAKVSGWNADAREWLSEKRNESKGI